MDNEKIKILEELNETDRSLYLYLDSISETEKLHKAIRDRDVQMIKLGALSATLGIGFGVFIMAFIIAMANDESDINKEEKF